MPRHVVVTLATIVGFAAVVAGCADDVDNSKYKPEPMAFHPIGAFDNIDFTGGTATAAMKHGADGCISELVLEAQASGGEHVLGIVLEPRKDFGMRVAKVNWKTPTSVETGSGWTTSPWWPADQLTEDEAKTGNVDKLLVRLFGHAKIGKDDNPGATNTRSVDLSTIQFGGDVVSELDSAATCKRCDSDSSKGDDCKAPYPTWRVRDFQPKSAWFNLEYDMNVFLGRPVVAILTQGW